MPSLPPLDVKRKLNPAPHVVILGAGASLAAFPNGDANGRQLPLMKNLVEVVGLQDILFANGVLDDHDNFEALYDKLASNPGMSEVTGALEIRLHDYFAGMQIPDEVTIYDLLLLSLREKDVIATFNWDPFLAQAYKRNRGIGRLPQILFLHGNVDVGVCREHMSVGFLEHHCPKCEKPMSPSKLLYPVQHKNYTADPYIKNEWARLQRYLQQAYLITIFGYSAPRTDVEARELLLNTWQKNPMREFAEIDIVDIRERTEVMASWSDFFVRQHYGIFPDVRRTIPFHHPRRSCEAFAMATLQQDPWPENDFPQTTSLAAIHAWLQPLLREEEAEILSGNPCPPIVG